MLTCPKPSSTLLEPNNIVTFGSDYVKGEAFLTSEIESKYDLPVVIDTGASTYITPAVDDFVGPLESTSLHEIRGIAGSTRVVGKGTVEWTIRDYWNVVRVIRTTAYYLPDIPIRLFSPQAYFQENSDKGQVNFRGKSSTLELPDGSRLEFPYHCNSNLPFMLTDEPSGVGVTRGDAILSHQHIQHSCQ